MEKERKTEEDILDEQKQKGLWRQLKWILFKHLAKSLVEYRLIGLDGMLYYAGPREMTATITEISEESAMCKVIINMPPRKFNKPLPAKPSDIASQETQAVVFEAKPS